LVFVATKLFRAGELGTVLRFDRLEFALAVSTLVVVALVGIEQGVVLAMVLSRADRTRRSARPRDTLLGREPGTDHWVPVDIGQATEEVPGVLVYLVYAPLWYGNADYFGSRARQMSDIDYTGLQALRDLVTELSRGGVALGIARSSHLVHHDLKHGALLQQLGGQRSREHG
jgi:MFS superfamily sulfate permease-like transporter